MLIKSKTEFSGPAKNRSKQVGKVVVKAALVATLFLSGCASFSKDHFIVGSVPDDYRTRHPIVVSESEKIADIVVPAGAKGLSFRDKEVVRAMAVNFRNSGSKLIAVLVPTGSSNANAAGAGARDAVHMLKLSHIPSNRIVVQHYNAAGHGESATLRVVYADLQASVEGKCGKWEEDLLETRENRNYGNFGCATQNNLAAMIAHPADLLGPRGTGNIDASRRTEVINNWRETGGDSYFVE